MDTEKRRTLTVIYATKAIKQLDEIWDWNERHYSLDHAKRYIQYLEQHIDTLSDAYEQGKLISSRPDLLHPDPPQIPRSRSCRGVQDQTRTGPRSVRIPFRPGLAGENRGGVGRIGLKFV